MKLFRLWLAALLTIGLVAPAYPADIYDWSTTAGDNDDADTTINWAENQLPSTVNDSARAMMKRQAEFLDDLGGVGTVGGTADAITLTSAIGALASGKIVAFKASGTNTTAVTLNVNSLGAKAIRRQGDTALSAGDILSGGIYVVRYDTAYNSAAGAWVLLNPQYASATLGQGKHTVWVPAGAMVPNTTSGAASGTAEMSTSKLMVKTLDFDASAEEFAQFCIGMPESWNESTVTAIYYWTHGSTTTNFGVAWGLEGTAISNDDVLDATWGTEIAVTDTGGTTNDLYLTAATSDVTLAGTPAAGDLACFRVTRVVGNGSDTMAVDAKLVGLKLLYTTNAATDD